MHYWSPFQQYAHLMSLNGQAYDYYNAQFNQNWQLSATPSNSAPEPANILYDHSQTKTQTKIEAKMTRIQEIELEQEKTKPKPKKLEGKDSRNTNATRNIKANILKDFVRSLKKDATQVLIALKVLNSDYSVKRFIEQLSENLPSQGKYIRTQLVVDLCKDHPDKQFSIILRVTLRNFLKGQYRNFVVLKRKNSFEYLRICREIQEKLYSSNKPSRSD